MGSGSVGDAITSPASRRGAAGAPRSAASRWEAAANLWLGAIARCSRTGSSNPSPSSGEANELLYENRGLGIGRRLHLAASRPSLVTANDVGKAIQNSDSGRIWARSGSAAPEQSAGLMQRTAVAESSAALSRLPAVQRIFLFLPFWIALPTSFAVTGLIGRDMIASLPPNCGHGESAGERMSSPDQNLVNCCSMVVATHNCGRHEGSLTPIGHRALWSGRVP